jgi:hypothetical protein
MIVLSHDTGAAIAASGVSTMPAAITAATKAIFRDVFRWNTIHLL